MSRVFGNDRHPSNFLIFQLDRLDFDSKSLYS